MVESTVIKSAIKRERGAFKIIYESCSPYVYAVVRRYIPDANEHKDVMQETFARVFLSIHNFDESKGDFKPWLRRIAINQCMQHFRKNKKQAAVVQLNMAAEPQEDLETQLTGLTKQDIEHLLSNMPEGYRQVFMLVAMDGYTHKEVAELLDISPETSRSQFLRARNWLKKNLINNEQKTLANGL